MKRFMIIASIIVVCNIVILLVYNIYPDSDNIIHGVFYNTKASNIDEALEFEFDVQKYLKNGKYEVNKAIFEGYNTQMLLKDIVSNDDKIHLLINSKIKHDLIKGEFLTLRKINNDQGNRPLKVEVKDVKGQMIPLVQYSINGDEELSINFDKEAIFKLNKVYIKIKGYSLIEYSLIPNTSYAGSLNKTN